MSSLLFQEIQRDLLRGAIALSVMFPAWAFAMQSEPVSSLVRTLLS